MRIRNIFSLKKSLRAKMFYSFVIVVFVPSAIIGLTSYYISVGILKDKVSTSFSQTVMYVRNSVEKELAQVQQFSDYLFVNKEVKKVLTTSYPAEERYQMLKDLENIEQVLENYSFSGTFRNVISLKLFTRNKEIFTFGIDENAAFLGNRMIMESKYFQEAWEKGGGIVWADLNETFSVNERRLPRGALTLFRAIKDTEYQSSVGIMFIQFNKQHFISILDNLDHQYNSDIFIVDSYGNLINQPESGFEYEELQAKLGSFYSTRDQLYIEDKERGNLILRYGIDEWGWDVVAVFPLTELTRDNRSIIVMTLAASGIGFLLCCLMWYVISYKLSLPIISLMRTMGKVREGNFDVKAEYTGPDEIGRLGHNFNYMLDRIKELFDHVIEEHTKMKDAEYRALQAQINPHFLYNTLNSIRWMAIIHKSDHIKNMVDALARLLKYSTPRNGSAVTVKGELTSIKDYLYIQQLAYGNKFAVEWDIDEALLDCSCLPFIVQPMVENAIFHGIEPKEGYGTIVISVYRDSGDIVLSIKDDGVGLTAEQAETILASEDAGTPGFSGIGIRNVHERLRMTYGPEYGLSMDSRLGSYTIVSARLPLSHAASSGGDALKQDEPEREGE